MFIHNTTVKVDKAIHDEWIDWQLNVLIPEIMSFNLFTYYKIFRLLNQENDEGVTYVIQYFTESKINSDRFLDHHSANFIEKCFKKWGDRFVSFDTLMQSVQ